MSAETGVCTECGATCELDQPMGVWIDPGTQDSENEGARCPENDDRAHEVTRAPDCTSCGDRGCSRCTTADGDTR